MRFATLALAELSPIFLSCLERPLSGNEIERVTDRFWHPAAIGVEYFCLTMGGAYSATAGGLTRRRIAASYSSDRANEACKVGTGLFKSLRQAPGARRP
jgi:hypothetical protein